mmetsp:Transcript_41939/g.91035  ORF Transcript_41939/g.91035 Transcript_41939/m.91035 type:complete len:300 (+) Transcript_41939:90-989(+)
MAVLHLHHGHRRLRHPRLCFLRETERVCWLLPARVGRQDDSKLHCCNGAAQRRLRPRDSPRTRQLHQLRRPHRAIRHCQRHALHLRHPLRLLHRLHGFSQRPLGHRKLWVPRSLQTQPPQPDMGESALGVGSHLPLPHREATRRSSTARRRIRSPRSLTSSARAPTLLRHSEASAATDDGRQDQATLGRGSQSRSQTDEHRPEVPDRASREALPLHRDYAAHHPELPALLCHNDGVRALCMQRRRGVRATLPQPRLSCLVLRHSLGCLLHRRHPRCLWLHLRSPHRHGHGPPLHPQHAR